MVYVMCVYVTVYVSVVVNVCAQDKHQQRKGSYIRDHGRRSYMLAASVLNYECP